MFYLNNDLFTNELVCFNMHVKLSCALIITICFLGNTGFLSAKQNYALIPNNSFDNEIEHEQKARLVSTYSLNKVANYIQLNRLPVEYEYRWALADNWGILQEVLDLEGESRINHTFLYFGYDYFVNEILLDYESKRITLKSQSMRYYYPDGIEPGFEDELGPLIEPHDFTFYLKLINQDSLEMTLGTDSFDYLKGQNFLLNRCLPDEEESGDCEEDTD
jgi:hypothetical protein